MASGSSTQDPNIDYIEVSPTTLLDSNRYTCEICGNGYARKQNLTLHHRVHNLPFTLKTREPNDPVPRRKYLCPNSTCVHHNRSHAIGDFGGLKKHYLRRHSTDKSYKCEICSKAYSVPADLKAHEKICVTKNYICHCGSRFSRASSFTAHKENCYAPDHGGAVRTMSHPQPFGISANTNTIFSNEGNNTLNDPHISCIQSQSNSYPFTTPYQSQPYQFGMGYADQLKDKIPSFFDGSSMHVQSSSSNLTPTRYNLGLQEMLNPITGSGVVGSYEQGGYKGFGVGSSDAANSGQGSYKGYTVGSSNTGSYQQGGYKGYGVGSSNTGSYEQGGYKGYCVSSGDADSYEQGGYKGYGVGNSDAGSYEQGGYKGYGVGSPLEYRGRMDMLNFQPQQQQPLQDMNTQGMNVHGDYGIHGLNGMFNPMIGSSNMGGYEQVGYKDYGVGSGNLVYSGGMETSQFQQYQEQQPLQNVNYENMNVHGNWGIINGTREGTTSYVDGGCMLDPLNSHNMTQVVAGSSEQGGYMGINDGAGSSGVGSYELGGYMGYGH